MGGHFSNNVKQLCFNLLIYFNDGAVSFRKHFLSCFYIHFILVGGNIVMRGHFVWRSETIQCDIYRKNMEIQMKQIFSHAAVFLIRRLLRFKVRKTCKSCLNVAFKLNLKGDENKFAFRGEVGISNCTVKCFVFSINSSNNILTRYRLQLWMLLWHVVSSVIVRWDQL